jgi:hypothetical protein
MDNENFRMFPRGFLGGGIKPQVVRTPKPYGEQQNQHQYMVNTHQDNGRSIDPNPIVESIYAAYIKNSEDTNSIQFRNSILEAAMNAFGTRSFPIWYSMQFKSLAAGDMHRRFLEDTLKFIRSGKREMSLENWASLVLITDEGNNIGSITEETKTFFMIQDFEPIVNAKYRTDLVDVIQEWCSNSGGIEDMLGTLHILFGNP